MTLSMYSNRLSEHAIALAGAVVVHIGIAAWMAPAVAAPVEIQPQVIRISMVAPSAPAQEPVKPQISETPVTVAPPKQDAVKVQPKIQKKPRKKPELKKKIEPAAVKSRSVPTSGPQAPDAVEKVAARTDPVFDAAYLQNTPPAYPPAARRQGVQGKVLLDVAVMADGRARAVTIARSSGSPLLDEAAAEAVRQWRFVPARQGKDAVEARVLVPVDFKLN
jgi:protein TonB